MIKFERLQRYFVRVYFNDFMLPYVDLLDNFQSSTGSWLPPLWLLAAKMKVLLFYSYYHEQRFFALREIFCPTICRRSSRNKHLAYVEPIRFSTNLDHLFLCETIRYWNLLPNNVPSCCRTDFIHFLQSESFKEIVMLAGRMCEC